MAVPVERVYKAMAHAAMPGLLPTPPSWWPANRAAFTSCRCTSGSGSANRAASTSCCCTSGSGPAPANRAASTSSCEKLESNMRLVSRVSSSSSAEKKPPPTQADGLDDDDDDDQSSTGRNDVETDDEPQPKMGLHEFDADHGILVASPDPSMLPQPSFRLVRHRFAVAN